MFHRNCLASIASSFALVALSSHAHANCAMPVSYTTKVAGNTVTVTPHNFGERGCPDSSGMLRENVDTGELVKLADFCSGTTAPDTATLTATSAAYVDECVPVGSYRYGFASPYSCHTSACSTDYFATTSVTTTLDANCARSSGNSAPTSATNKPWTTVTAICTYQSHYSATGGASNQGAGGQSNTVGGAVGVAGQSEPGDDIAHEPEGGCSIAAPTGTTTVIGVNLATMLLGLLLGRWRRNREGTKK
jgi:hypothetical protein